MTAVPFSAEEQRTIDSAKRYEKAAAQLRKEAEDKRKQRQLIEDERVKIIEAAEKIRKQEEFDKLRKAQQLAKFERGVRTLESHFRERISLYDANLLSFNKTNTAYSGEVTITIRLKAKP